MVNLNDIVQYLHPGAEPLRDYTVAADRNGQRISQWNTLTLGDQPTPEQLAETEASPEFVAWMLAKLKKIKNLTIDARTAQLIGQGFVWNGSRFSLSANAQLNWTNLYIARDFQSYPLGISTLADGEYLVANAAEMAALYASGLLFTKGIIDGGRNLKILVGECQTEEDILSIVDPR